jgi:hypothetical protein
MSIQISNQILIPIIELALSVTIQRRIIIRSRNRRRRPRNWRRVI